MGGSIQPRSPLKFTLDIFVVRRIDAYVENEERLPDAYEASSRRPC
jgi:hypothetical protein